MLTSRCTRTGKSYRFSRPVSFALCGEEKMIPKKLERYFHDSTLEIQSWNQARKSLQIRIEKEIGPEKGIISLSGTSFICLPPFFPGESVRACPVKELGDDFWCRYTGVRDEFESNDIAFLFVSQEGPEHVVIAKEMKYEIT